MGRQLTAQDRRRRTWSRAVFVPLYGAGLGALHLLESWPLAAGAAVAGLVAGAVAVLWWALGDALFGRRPSAGTRE